MLPPCLKVGSKVEQPQAYPHSSCGAGAVAMQPIMGSRGIRSRALISTACPASSMGSCRTDALRPVAASFGARIPDTSSSDVHTLQQRRILTSSTSTSTASPGAAPCTKSGPVTTLASAIAVAGTGPSPARAPPPRRSYASSLQWNTTVAPLGATCGGSDDARPRLAQAKRSGMCSAPSAGSTKDSLRACGGGSAAIPASPEPRASSYPRPRGQGSAQSRSWGERKKQKTALTKLASKTKSKLQPTMRVCLGALVASAALFAGSGAFMMAPSSLPPAALSFSRSAAALQGAGRLAPQLRALSRGPAAGVRMGVLDDILARKEKEVEALKANLPEEAAKLLEKPIKHKNTFLKAIKKPKGTISVVGQMKTRQPNIGQFSEIPAPDFLSAHMYEAGAAACSICTDEEAYGFNYDDLAAVAKQQARYKGNFPGPLPIVAHDFFIDECQLAVAASKGAKAVNLNVALYKGDVAKLKDLIEAADKLGMDALVEVHNKAELDQAVEAAAKIIGVCNRDMETFDLMTPSDYQTREWVKPFEETVFNLVKDIPQGIVPVAMGGVNETLTAWSLRDEGYSSIIVGEGIVRGSEMRMSTGPYQSAYNEAKGLIMAFRSKVRARGDEGQGACLHARARAGERERASERAGLRFCAWVCMCCALDMRLCMCVRVRHPSAHVHTCVRPPCMHAHLVYACTCVGA